MFLYSCTVQCVAVAFSGRQRAKISATFECRQLRYAFLFLIRRFIKDIEAKVLGIF